MHICGFHKFEFQFLVFSCNFAACLQDTILLFCQKTSGRLFLIFFALFSKLIFNFTYFVIQVKENLHASILARLTDENKYICRFHASFSVLKAVSTTRLLLKNSCCESFKIIFQVQVIPFSPTFMQKKSSF